MDGLTVFSSCCVLFWVLKTKKLRAFSKSFDLFRGIKDILIIARAIQAKRLEMEVLESPHSPYHVNPSNNQIGAIVSPELVKGNYNS